MKRTCFLLLLAWMGMTVFAGNQELIKRLDTVLDSAAYLHQSKQIKMELLKKNVANAADVNSQLYYLDDLYEEYHVYQFDSAMVYVDKLIRLADEVGDGYYQTLGRINKAELLAMGSLYPEALNVLGEIDVKELLAMERDMAFKYYFIHFKVYQYWANYCDDQTYTPRYLSLSREYLQKSIAYLDASNPYFDYFMGEYYIFVKPDNEKALRHYFRLIRKVGEDNRYYAMAAFAIANNYSAHDNKQKYEEYIIKACISDLRSCTRETMAMQELAMFLYENGSDILRAERYINYTLQDAKAYHNRLRIMEISGKLPLIVSAYHKTLTTRNRYLRIGLICISLLMVVVLILAYFFRRQNKQLAANKRELSHNNDLLSSLNDRLMHLNGKLLNTNARREQLAKLYIDLCAQYIGKLGKFETLVQRKIKANQVKDLLSMASSTRLSEEDAATFLNRFDHAFLNLYPSFVSEFNALLKDGEQVQVKQQGQMTTELRMFALLRLGVTESSEMAALLFYTPRTIYNYRSSFKNKAKNRETFEADVSKLCTVIHDEE